MTSHTSLSSSWRHRLWTALVMAFGAFLAVFSLEIFLVPNEIIDGGVVGLSILLSKFMGPEAFYPSVVLLNLPFMALAYRMISKTLVLNMIFGLGCFTIMGFCLREYGHVWFTPYKGELLEVVTVGGLLLGIGVGLVIRAGGCLDGSEILGLILNRKYQVTVGKVVLIANLMVFSLAGFFYGDWHPVVKSLITFFVVMKTMDMVIMGLDEMKSVTIFTQSPDEVSKVLMHQLGLGLTVLLAKGGYSRERRDVLFLIAERLQLAEIKEVVLNQDPYAVIAIENLNEVASANPMTLTTKLPKEPKKKLYAKL